MGLDRLELPTSRLSGRLKNPGFPGKSVLITGRAHNLPYLPPENIGICRTEAAQYPAQSTRGSAHSKCRTIPNRGGRLTLNKSGAATPSPPALPRYGLCSEVGLEGPFLPSTRVSTGLRPPCFGRKPLGIPHVGSDAFVGHREHSGASPVQKESGDPPYHCPTEPYCGNNAPATSSTH